MRLNDGHRDIFVAQAMQDVPRHPYEDDMLKLGGLALNFERLQH